MTQQPLFPDPRLVALAVREGERVVVEDPRYPPPGNERAAFWRQVREVLMAVAS